MRRASDQASFYHLGVGHARQGGMAVVSALKDGLGGVGRTGPVSFSGAPVAATRPAPASAGVRSAGCAAGPWRFARTCDAPCRGLRPAPE